MTGNTRREADERLAAALARADLADGREAYRERLRQLKQENAGAFRRITDHYEQRVQPGLLEGSDPLAVWLAFGITLAGATGAGQAVIIDVTGRSRAWTGDYEGGGLLLFLPDDRQAEAMPLAVPARLSAAQAASLDLLVSRKLSL